jgi:prepilin-type N-terminal cleavage/methylation domain-containing protein/prepilin-type processing-associated H-X9-DG protein
MPRSRRNAFTLVELLVVIGIIAVLVAVLLPALNRARAQANVVKCMSNLQQIGVGIQVYVAQNKGLMPLIWDRHWTQPAIPGMPHDGRGWTMFGYLLEYSKIPMFVFRCPADHRDYTLSVKQFWQPLDSEVTSWFEQFDYMVMMIGYGVPTRQVPWSATKFDSRVKPGGPLSAARIKKPHQLMLVWDGVYSFFTYGGNAPSVFYKTTPATYKSYLVTRHGGGRMQGPNCLFADGHVQPRIDWTPLANQLNTDDYFTMPRR